MSFAHSPRRPLQGLLGKPQLVQYIDLAFRLKTDKGRLLTLRLRKPGLFLPAAKEILLAHQDPEDAGFRVDKTYIFVRELLDRFDGTCERNLTEMLGMEWEHDIEAGTSVLHQRAFTEKLLKAFGSWEYSKTTKTPQAAGMRLSAADKPAMSDPVLQLRYRVIVGALGWLNQGAYGRS